MKRILVCGSIATDVIMTYPSKFSDLIMKDHLDHFNLAFTVPFLEKLEGGTAQNIAYSLGLLGLKDQTIMLGAVGKDFIPNNRLASVIDYSSVYRDENLFTAVCYIITAEGGQQIISFYPGAMGSASKINLEQDLGSENFGEIAYAIISPNDKVAMLKSLSECNQKGIPTFFDPGQALELFSQEELRDATQKASFLICNEHEFALFQKKSGYTQQELIQNFDKIIVTLGSKGVMLLDKEKEIILPGIVVENPKDATGCGDAFRSGLLYGLINGKSWEDSAKIGNKVASYVVQHQGGVNHFFTKENIEN